MDKHTMSDAKPGTICETRPAAGIAPERVTIMRPRKAHMPLPGPDWFIVKFADGGGLCMHRDALRVVEAA